MCPSGHKDTSILQLTPVLEHEARVLEIHGIRAVVRIPHELGDELARSSVGALGGGRVPFRKDQRFVIDVIIIAIGGADPFHRALAWDAIRLEINDMWCGQVLVSARV